MNLPILKQIGLALRTLNPEEVRALADRPVMFGVLAADENVASDIHDFVAPRDLSAAKAAETEMFGEKGGIGRGLRTHDYRLR